MANEVFANGLEIACQAADGKSVACFPDVCFTPPSPPAGWIPIPYANTAYAKDTTNGSKTVFISGKPVMKKDLSYFKTSTGNEPAAGPKGVMSHVKKGKAYFAGWSMNVKVEGQNVDRHTDLMTHNHGSSPNTGPWFYADTAATKSACAGTRNKAEKACQDKTAGKKKDKKSLKGGKGKPEDWKKNHCGGIDGKNEKRRQAQDKLDKKRKEFEKLAEKAKKVMSAVDDMEAKLKKLAAKKLASVAGKAAVKGWLGPIGWAWTAYDVVSTGAELYQERDKIKQVLDGMKNIKQEMDKAWNEGVELKKILDGIEDEVVAAASENECLRARKCILAPHRNKGAACCPGQTSHHLMPNAMFQEAGGRGNAEHNIADCPGYDTNDAPCVCVEGFNQHKGTHGKIHKNTDDLLKDKVQDNRLSLRDAKAVAVEAHQKTFDSPTCSERCLEAQLNAYFNKACKKTASVRPVDARGKTIISEPSRGASIE